jgi:hypothetical protein
MTLALLNRTWSFGSLDRKSLALALMVERSARSWCRKISLPDEVGCRALMFVIAV